MEQQNKNQTESELKRTKLKYICDSYTNQHLFTIIKNSDFLSNLQLSRTNVIRYLPKLAVFPQISKYS
jgi:acetylglutamate synthase